MKPAWGSALFSLSGGGQGQDKGLLEVRESVTNSKQSGGLVSDVLSSLHNHMAST